MKALSALTLFSLLVLGCNDSPKLGPQEISKFDDAERFAASSTPYTKAALVLAGTTIPVELIRMADGKTVSFQLVAHGQAIEVERYESDEAGLRVVAAGGETYSPPIPLLRFPFEIGDEWDWKGHAASGSIVHPAEAAITAGKEVLNVPGGPYDAVRISVALRFHGTEASPSARPLDFWFVPGKGIMKRQFGSSSTRGPAPQPSTP